MSGIWNSRKHQSTLYAELATVSARGSADCTDQKETCRPDGLALARRSFTDSNRHFNSAPNVLVGNFQADLPSNK